MSALVLVAACAIPKGEQKSPAELPGEMADHGALEVFLTDQTTDGRNLKLRGKIINPYDEAIEGIRLIYLDVATGAENRILGHALKIMDIRIDARDSTMLRWDIQTMYAGAPGGRFQVTAFAIHRGGVPLPWPPGWEEGDDDNAHR